MAIDYSALLYDPVYAVGSPIPTGKMNFRADQSQRDRVMFADVQKFVEQAVMAAAA